MLPSSGRALAIEYHRAQHARRHAPRPRTEAGTSIGVAIFLALVAGGFVGAAVLGGAAARQPRVNALSRRLDPLTHAERARFGLWVIKDPRVPALVRYLPLIAFMYWVAPIDFIPDPLPGIGYADDRIAVALALWCLVQWTPAVAVEEHLQRIEYFHDVMEQPTAEDDPFADPHA